MDRATKALRWIDRHRVGITLALALGITVLALIVFVSDFAFYLTAAGKALLEVLPSGFNVVTSPGLEAVVRRLAAWTFLLLLAALFGILSGAYGLIELFSSLAIEAFLFRKITCARREQAENIDKRLLHMAEQLQARGLKTLFGYDKHGHRDVLYCNSGADRPVTAFRFHPHADRYPKSTLADTEASSCWHIKWRVECGCIAKFELRLSKKSEATRLFWCMPIELCDPASGEEPAEHLDYADGGVLLPRGKFATGGFDDPRIAEAMRRGLDRIGE